RDRRGAGRSGRGGPRPGSVGTGGGGPPASPPRGAAVRRPPPPSLAPAALGHPERAVVVAGAAARLRESVGGGLTVESGRWVTEHPRDAARRQLTDTQIDRAWAQGRTMSLEDALAYARS